MCKEMMVIPVDKAVDKKRICGKWRGQGGREAQGFAFDKKYICKKHSLDSSNLSVYYRNI
jgi:hypothetical protein